MSKGKSNIEYHVTLVNVSGQVQVAKLFTLKALNYFVDDINNEKYWSVQKIEKFRRYDFKYDKNIIHAPLHFCLDDVTEMHNCDNTVYSFLKIDESLTNVTRRSTKIIVE